ncbi:MAG: B12-binding domain-containing radical SAM protein [Fibrobacterota bacterium]
MTKGRVLFIEPMGSQFNVYSKYMSIPLLGPVLLGTLAKNKGWEVSVLNENILGRKVSDEELVWADVLCLSCMTATVDRGKEIARQYKALRKKNKLSSRACIGGIHASMLPEEVTSEFDHVICGEGEYILEDLLRGRIKEKIIKGRRVDDLDSLPVPDFTLIKEWRKIAVWPVMTSRGCPYTCNFCSVTQMFGRKYRTQSPRRVLEEIKHLEKGHVFFVDDNFAADLKRTEAILDGMLQNGFKRPWSAQVRTDIAKKPELVAKMKKAGCVVLYMGLESINPQSLHDMKKKQNVDDIKRAIKVIQSTGIQVHGMFMLGNDPDTPEIFKATSSFARKTGLNFIQCNVLTPLPGTEVFRKLESEGRLLHKDWKYYDGLHVVFRPKQMSSLELQKGMVTCFKSFYSLNGALRDILSSSLKVMSGRGFKYPSEARLQAFFPFLMKLAGKSIVSDWVKQNRSYMHTLQKT